MPASERIGREQDLRDAVLRGDVGAWQSLYDDAFAEVLPGSFVDGSVTLVGVCSYALSTNAVSFSAAT